MGNCVPVNSKAEEIDTNIIILSQMKNTVPRLKPLEINRLFADRVNPIEASMNTTANSTATNSRRDM